MGQEVERGLCCPIGCHCSCLFLPPGEVGQALAEYQQVLPGGRGGPDVSVYWRDGGEGSLQGVCQVGGDGVPSRWPGSVQLESCQPQGSPAQLGCGAETSTER